ncbi:MAG: cofactor-independent phosphoglycerate mutase [Actinomycetota bacterium]
MKYAVVLMDGAADRPLAKLGERTPLQAAKKPAIDSLARHSMLGMVSTIPAGMEPGSDTANLSVLGYDPLSCHTGRSPLEAVSMGVELGEADVAFRCNLVTLSEGSYRQKKMVDHSAGEITTPEAEELIGAVGQELATEFISFYPGVGYRHLMVWKGGPHRLSLTPPHDILGKAVGDYLPRGDKSSRILDIMEKSTRILEGHPVNLRRKEEGEREANSIWIWGQGKKPELTSFFNKYGIRGSVISAVDLIKGIGICAGLKAVKVEGATGNLHTNFRGKAEAAIEELKDRQFVYIHIEAPDECGHQGDIQGKIKSIEEIDRKVIRPVWDYLKKSGDDFKIMVLSDHPTPISVRTHTPDPVPFLIYSSRGRRNNPRAAFDEFWPQKNGPAAVQGHTLMDMFFKKMV